MFLRAFCAFAIQSDLNTQVFETVIAAEAKQTVSIESETKALSLRFLFRYIFLPVSLYEGICMGVRLCLHTSLCDLLLFSLVSLSLLMS